MAELTQPHDKLFKGLLDQPGTAGALLRERLPSEVVALLSDDPFELIPGEYVDEALRGSQSDRLYRAKMRSGGDLLLYVLIDHKSTPELDTILQLLGYILRIWLQLTGGKAESLRSLPPVLPLVVYHGAREWNVSLSLHDMINAPDDIKSYLPDFRYILVDLGPIPDPELSAYPPLRAGLLALKYSFRDCDTEALLIQAFTDAKDQPILFRMLTVYVTTVYSNVNSTLLRQAIRKVKPEWEDEMLSIAAKEWKTEGIAEGISQGISQGITQGKAEMVLRLLCRRFGPLSSEDEKRVRTANSEQLDEWSERLLDARELADVFDATTKH